MMSAHSVMRIFTVSVKKTSTDITIFFLMILPPIKGVRDRPETVGVESDQSKKVSA